MRLLQSLLAVLLFVALPAAAQEAKTTDYPAAVSLLSTDKTAVGESIAYPDGQAKITSLIVTIAPGAETGFHKHGVPLYVYVLEGEATVDYGDKGKRVYKAGEAFMEAMDTWHNGTNPTDKPVRVLAVYMGGGDAQSVIHKK